MCGCNSNFTGSQEERKTIEEEIKKLQYQSNQILNVLRGSAPTHVKEGYAMKRDGMLKKIDELKSKLSEEAKELEVNIESTKKNWGKYALIAAVGVVGFLAVRKFVFKKK
jgi:hypothetical protein